MRQYNADYPQKKKPGSILIWNSFQSNNVCAEFKPTVPQFTLSAAATQRASALCGITSLCQPVCCCLGAVPALGDAGIKSPDTQRRPSEGKPHHCFHNYIYIWNASPGEDKMMLRIGTVDQQSLHAAAFQSTNTCCCILSTCLENWLTNDFTIASFQIHHVH